MLHRIYLETTVLEEAETRCGINVRHKSVLKWLHGWYCSNAPLSIVLLWTEGGDT